VVFRKPTTFHRLDASEFGIGGYNINSGFAWRFEIPTHLRLRVTLNSLEFLACVITIWIDVLMYSTMNFIQKIVFSVKQIALQPQAGSGNPTFLIQVTQLYK
jgi:hypothetical protein